MITRDTLYLALSIIWLVALSGGFMLFVILQ